MRLLPHLVDGFEAVIVGLPQLQAISFRESSLVFRIVEVGRQVGLDSKRAVDDRKGLWTCEDPVALIAGPFPRECRVMSAD